MNCSVFLIHGIETLDFVDIRPDIVKITVAAIRVLTLRRALSEFDAAERVSLQSPATGFQFDETNIWQLSVVSCRHDGGHHG
jgi:hypothetical protein